MDMFFAMHGKVVFTSHNSGYFYIIENWYFIDIISIIVLRDKYSVLYILETRKKSSNFRGLRGSIQILGEVYATWREFRNRDAEGHAEGWMWFKGSWEGKRGHLSMVLVVALCVPPSQGGADD